MRLHCIIRGEHGESQIGWFPVVNEKKKSINQVQTPSCSSGLVIFLVYHIPMQALLKQDPPNSMKRAWMGCLVVCVEPMPCFSVTQQIEGKRIKLSG